MLTIGLRTRTTRGREQTLIGSAVVLRSNCKWRHTCHFTSGKWGSLLTANPLANMLQIFTTWFLNELKIREGNFHLCFQNIGLMPFNILHTEVLWRCCFYFFTKCCRRKKTNLNVAAELNTEHGRPTYEMQWRQADRSQTLCRLRLEFRGRHLVKFGGQPPFLPKK